jgi:HEAT repeat protein
MKRGGRRATVAELMGRRKSDPEYQAARERGEAERRCREMALREAEAPLLEELHAVGIEVGSAWDLVNISMPYPAALPILLDHLGRPYPSRVREGIARALAVRDARFAWAELVRLYCEEDSGTDAKDGIAVALAAAANRAVLDEVIALLRDPRHGQSRVLLLGSLRRLRARSSLEEFASDPLLGQEAQRLLTGRRR